jgi:hypothetical protein
MQMMSALPMARLLSMITMMAAAAAVDIVVVDVAAARN